MTKSTKQTVDPEGPDESGQTPISLVIPRRAEYVGLCRLVAGVVGARESLDEEVIADLKLVVTEACTCYLWGPDGSPPMQEGDQPEGRRYSLRVDFHVRPDAWEIIISDPERQYRIPSASLCDPATEGGLGLTIIRALVDSVEETHTDAEGSILRLVKRLPPRPAPPIT